MGIIMSWSRGAWLGVIAGSFVVIALRGRRSDIRENEREVTPHAGGAALREREHINNLFEELCGARLTFS